MNKKFSISYTTSKRTIGYLKEIGSNYNNETRFIENKLVMDKRFVVELKMDKILYLHEKFIYKVKKEI